MGAVTEKPAFRRGCLDLGARRQQGSQGPRCFAHRVLLSLQTALGARRRSSMASRSWHWTSSGTSAASNARPAASSSLGSTSASRSLPCPACLTSACPQAWPHMALGLVHLCRTPTHLGVAAPQCWGVAGEVSGVSPGRRSPAELGTSSYLAYCTSQNAVISSQSLLLRFTLCMMVRVTFVKCKS